jgi:hypothetical protein
MANESNNAEEQLKAYAAERRQAVPGAMHPATRNLLQGEVRRAFGNPEAERRARLRWRWLQAIAWLVILAAIPIFLMPRNPSEKKMDEATPTSSKDVNLPTDNAPGHSAIVLSDTKEPVKPPVTEPPAKEAVAIAAKAAPAGSAQLRDEVKTETSSRQFPMLQQEVATQPAKKEKDQEQLAVSVVTAKQTALARSAAAPAAATPAPATSIEVSNLTLNFANTVPNQQILSNFKFEQNGQRLKISEKDGSVYPGRVLSQQGGVDVFQAAGMNRTLHKATIITGQVVRATSGNIAQQAPGVSGTQNVYVNNNRVANDSAQNSANNAYNNNEVRVQGAAIVGNTQYKVDAQVTPGP